MDGASIGAEFENFNAGVAICRLRANPDDWASANASYGQVQTLDKKIQLTTGLVGNQQEACASLDRKSKDQNADANDRAGEVSKKGSPKKDEEDALEQLNHESSSAEPEKIAEEIASGHAYEKHVIELAEFKDIGIDTREKFSRLIKNIVSSANGDDVRVLSRGRTAYWDSKTATIVIRDPFSPDGGTAFRPKIGRLYFEQEVK
jgi:filamentous hemagglutinin